MNSHGGDAPATSYGAGGGGGGGDAPDVFDSSGRAGEGGDAANAVTQSINVSAFAGTIIIDVTVGAGGIGGNGSYDGGDGASGAVQYSALFASVNSYTLPDLVNSNASERRLKENLEEIPDAISKVCLLYTSPSPRDS